MQDIDLRIRFNSIMTRGSKTNTYKFALAKFLLDYTDNFTESQILDMVKNGQMARVKYDLAARGFLKYYWHQECKYRIRQNSDPKKLPYVVRIIREQFDDDDAKKPFADLPKTKVDGAADRIQSRVFGRGSFSHVVPRFQNLRGVSEDEKCVFYEYDSDQMSIRPESLLFLKNNKQCLLKTVVLEWSKFLERRNNMPMLISKIENERARRGNLTKYKKMFESRFCKCFYCETGLREKSIHVDHFIPWSYIFEDGAWNLVLACDECNCKKSDSLAEETYLDALINRNYEYGPQIAELEKSLRDLGTNAKEDGDSARTWEGQMRFEYKNCKDYEFSTVIMR